MNDPLIQGLVGRQIGRYRLETLIAVGGMGVVFRGVHVDLGRPVAIKIVKPGVAIDESLLRRLTTEAQIAATLHHPGIAAVHDIGEDSGFHYIVLDYIAGSDLGSLIEREGRLDIPRALQYVEAIAAALQYAHDLGVVHRDIKPSNVLLASDGRPVLTDFGIAKAAVGSKLTAAGAMLGTPEYMAPEQAQGHPADGRSDLYSLGVVFYEMISGRLPFEGDTPIATALKHITDQPVPVTRWLPDAPRAVQDFLQKALAKNPADRYVSGREMGQAAAAVRLSIQAGQAEGHQVTEAPVKRRPSGPGRPPGRVSPRPQDPTGAVRQAARSNRPPVGATVLIDDRARQSARPHQAGPRSSISPGLMLGGLGGGFLLVILVVAILRSTSSVAPQPADDQSPAVLPPKAPVSGILHVNSVPTGAEVLVDGVGRGTTPARLELAPGSYIVTVWMTGYVTQTRYVILGEGALEDLTFDLSPIAAQVPPASSQAIPTPSSVQLAELTLTVRPGPARFYVNGRYAGVGDTVSLSLPPGNHIVTARKQGFKDTEKRVALTPGETRRTELILTPRPVAATPLRTPPPIPPPPDGSGAEKTTPPEPRDTVPPDEVFAKFPFVRRNAVWHPDGIMLQLVALKSAVRKGEAIEFLIRLHNPAREERRISFPTGQMVDLYILDYTGGEIYRWSEGRTFPVSRRLRIWNSKANHETLVSWVPPALPWGTYYVRAVMLADTRVETGLTFTVRAQ